MTTAPDTRFRLGELLAARKPEPLTQAELVRLSGVSAVTVNRIVLNRTAQVSLATLGKLAMALGVEPGDLIVSGQTKRSKVK